MTILYFRFLIFFAGGEIISQQYAGRAFHMSIYADLVSVSLQTQSSRAEVRIPSNLLDNKWHTIEFIYQMGTLLLLIDRQETVIANATYNKIFLTDAPNNDAAILILGTSYSGCMLQGPGINFNSRSVKDVDSILFGPCPLMQGSCKQNDILVRAQIDQCLNDPCMSHGSCVSKADTYEVSVLMIKRFLFNLLEFLTTN